MISNHQIAVNDVPMRRADHKAKPHGAPRKGDRFNRGRVDPFSTPRFYGEAS